MQWHCGAAPWRLRVRSADGKVYVIHTTVMTISASIDTLSSIGAGCGIEMSVRAFPSSFDARGRGNRDCRLFAGRYLLRHELGRGGMGAVYVAFDLSEWRQVALKKIEPRGAEIGEMFEERFQREIRALAGIKHPGIPLLYASGRSPEGEAYFTMELVGGERLRTRLVAGALEPVQALSLAIELGQALAATHQAGVVHRDVKPGNVLVEPNGRVRLIDFGACSFLPHFYRREDIMPEKITATRARWATGDFDAVATPGYSAPELIRRDQETTPRADIYSLCAILYEMVAGRPLRDATSRRDRVIAREEFAPEFGPLADLLARGASLESFDRHQSMVELVGELEAVRAELLRRREQAERPRAAVAAVTPRRWTFTVGMGVAAVTTLLVAWSGAGVSDAGALELAIASAHLADAELVAAEEPVAPAPQLRTVPPATSARIAPATLSSAPPASPAPSLASKRRRQSRRTLDEASAQVRGCYDRYGGSKIASVQVRVTIDIDGRARDVQLDGDAISSLLLRCVTDAVQEHRFAPGPDPLVVRHTFSLRTP